MKKILLVSMMVLMLGACTSTEEKTTQISRGDGSSWWQEIGEADSDYWWITEYDEDMSE